MQRKHSWLIFAFNSGVCFLFNRRDRDNWIFQANINDKSSITTSLRSATPSNRKFRNNINEEKSGMKSGTSECVAASRETSTCMNNDRWNVCHSDVTRRNQGRSGQKYWNSSVGFNCSVDISGLHVFSSFAFIMDKGLNDDRRLWWRSLRYMNRVVNDNWTVFTARVSVNRNSLRSR